MIAREKSLRYIPKLLPIPVGRQKARVYFVDARSRQNCCEYEIEVARMMVRFGYDILIGEGGCWWRGHYWRVEKLRGDVREEWIKEGKIILDVRRSGQTVIEVVREVLKLAGEGIEFEEIYVLDGRFYCVINGEIVRKNLHDGRGLCYNKKVIK